MTNADRRIARGLIIETTIRITAAKKAKIDWRTAKWNGSPIFIRAAAAGLLPKQSRTPITIRIAVAPSSRWSVVHHQTPSLVRSVRGKACCWSVVIRSRPSSRSEEHTSELQSRPHLVCRLLLEKKKKIRKLKGIKKIKKRIEKNKKTLLKN